MRPTWKCEIKLTLVNGQKGVISLDADQLLTMRELKEQFSKALAMAEELRRAPAEEQPAAGWKPTMVVNE
jgi:hypothetical protein